MLLTQKYWLANVQGSRREMSISKNDTRLGRSHLNARKYIRKSNFVHQLETTHVAHVRCCSQGGIQPRAAHRKYEKRGGKLSISGSTHWHAPIPEGIDNSLKNQAIVAVGITSKPGRISSTNASPANKNIGSHSSSAHTKIYFAPCFEEDVLRACLTASESLLRRHSPLYGLTSTLSMVGATSTTSEVEGKRTLLPEPYVGPRRPGEQRDQSNCSEYISRKA